MKPVCKSLASWLLFLVALSFGLPIPAGCGGREPDQRTCSGAYAIYRTAVERGDHARLYRLLDPDVAAQIDQVFSNVQAAHVLVRNLPVPMQADHTALIGSPAVRQAGSATEFPGALGGGAHGDGVEVNFLTSLTRQFKSCVEDPPDSGQFTAIPMDGIGVRFVRRGDGLLYHIPSDAERVNLQKALVQSARALEHIRNTGRSLGQDGSR